MNNIPREMLARIVAKYGRDVAADARRCESLLNDLCGAHRREINVLVNAVEERVPLDLLAGGSTPLELLLTRIERKFENQTGLTAEAARWAVESWALALGTATSAQIAERERKTAAQSTPKAETVKPFEPAGKPLPNNSNANRANPPAPKIQTPAPKPAPPVNRQPTINASVNPFPPAAPPVRIPANRQPTAQAPAANQSSQPAPASPVKRGFGIFRGCFLIIVLLVVAAAALVFVAPYALETMRETQRERNNEPPRFPVR